MDDSQLQRYGRHILLDEIGIEGQQRILNAHALVIGLGGLGSPAALYLAASGVGKLTLCDHDQVDLSNLQRQIAHKTSGIGRSKVESARDTLLDINPDTECICVAQRVDAETLDQLVASADVVLDCSDNFATRYAVNRACLAQRTPLVSGAAILFSGQACVFDFRAADSPCYNCLFPEESAAQELRCATTGVFSPLTGIIGTIQAAEAVKLLAGIDTGLSARLLTVDALSMNIRQSAFRKDPDCAVCANRHRIPDCA